MLSQSEIEKAKWQLSHVPNKFNNKQKQNFCHNINKKLKEHLYASRYPPFESSPHERIFVNRTTTEKTLIELNDAIINSEIFTLDTESTIIPYQPNKPSLIQLQIITSEIFSIVILVEMCHLPRRDEPTFQLIKNLFDSLLQPEKKIFIWGKIDELKQFVQYGLFTKNQIHLPVDKNVQEVFNEYWVNNFPHQPKSTSGGTSTCKCKSCFGIKHDNSIAIQDAVAFELNRWIDKRLTKNPFDIGLDPQLYRWNRNQLDYRQQMCDYAVNDCDAIYQIIVSTRILDEQHLSSEQSIEIIPMDQTMFTLNDDNDDDIYLFGTTSTNRIITIDRYSKEEQLTLSDRTPQTNSNIIAPTHGEPIGLLSKEDRRRIHNRRCTIKQRHRAYQHELIFRNIDRRFSITNIKKFFVKMTLSPPH